MRRPQLWPLRQNEQGKGAQLSEQKLLDLGYGGDFFAQGLLSRALGIEGGVRGREEKWEQYSEGTKLSVI